MIDIADVGMIFVRCRAGISHHPAEHVELADADAGARVLLRFIENFRPRDAALSEDFLPARSHALEGSDLIAASLLRNVSSGTYIDVGANHPIRQSNTRHFYEKGWRGLAIDGNGEFEAAWREQRPGDIFVSALVSDKIKSVDFLLYPDRTMSTIDDGSIARYSARYPGQQIQKQVRKTVTLHDLKSQYLDQREVHLLSVDVEGEDLNCLVGARLDL